MTDLVQPSPSNVRSVSRSRWRLAIITLLVIGAFALLGEHWAHALGYWPYLLLLLCPLLHLFGHRHGGNDQGHPGP